MSGFKDENYRWISTLRGFAALLVFVAHLPVPFPHIVSFAIGRTGVALFFLMTGYLSLEARKKRSRGQYVFNRFVRMYPVFWLILAATYVVKIVVWKASFFGHLKDLVLNMTLFNEFLGSDCIIGTSWMMPIQVCFFVMLTILSPDFFSFWNERRAWRLFMAGCGLTLVIAVLRAYTGKSLPTAFGLLILLSIIGLQYHENGSLVDIKEYLILYAAIFVPSVILSYKDEAAGYVVAYTAGMVLFVLAEKFNVTSEAMDKLGSVGFSFFLAADIPHIILEKIIPTDNFVGLVIFIIIKFAVSLGMALVLTKYVERPMLKKAKGIEASMK